MEQIVLRQEDATEMTGAFTQSVTVMASPERLFDLSQNYPRRLTWDPFLRRAELLDADAPAVEVRARCVAHSGLAMTFATGYYIKNPQAYW